MTTNPKSLDRHTAASVIARLKPDILRDWETIAREKVDAAKKQSRLALRDSLPQFMDQLVATLHAIIRKVKPQSMQRSLKVMLKIGQSNRIIRLVRSFPSIRFFVQLSQTGLSQKTLSILRLGTSFTILSTTEFANRHRGFRSLIPSASKLRPLRFKQPKIEAERANLAKTSFLANMSQEIRTPLGAVMGFVDLLRDKNLSEEESTNYLAVIDRNSHHVLRIIDDILDLTKVEAGKMIIEKMELSLVEFLSEFASLSGFKAREKGIVFEFSADTPLPESIISDPTRLRQILSNVVGNAIKFTEKGRVELVVSYEDQHLEFRVTDTGRGISPEQRRNLFQAFSQADSSTTRKYGGTGLGLVLTKKLAQAFGGDFDLFESGIGKGSVFKASIPVEVPERAMLVPVKKFRIAPTPDEADHANLKNFNVLVVEDSPDNQMLLRMILKKVGAKVTVANDGLEGVEQAMTKRYDVILMDIQMPNLDGHEATRELRSKRYAGPIVALTAHAMTEERERAIQSGFSHFLIKPIDRKSLLDLLEVLKSAVTLRI